MRRRAWVAGAAAGVALLAPAASDAAEVRLGVAMKFFGSRPHEVEPIRATAPSMDFFLTAARWNNVQPSCKAIRRGRYNWRRLDQSMNALAAMGLRTYALLSHGPSCASVGGEVGDRPKPKYIDEWAAFARRMVARYGGPRRPLKGVEVWSEPNLRSWPTSPESYGRAFVRVAKAIGKANRRTKMISGGLGRKTPSAFTRKLYRVRGFERKADALGMHLYSPNPGSLVKRLKAVQRAAPGRTPLMVTEHGWSTCPRPDLDRTKAGKCVAMRQQATYMGRTVRRLRRTPAARVTHYFWFTVQDFNEPPRRRCPASPKDFYGFYRFGGGPKPSQAVWERLTGTQLPRRIPEQTRARPCRGDRDTWR